MKEAGSLQETVGPEGEPERGLKHKLAHFPITSNDYMRVHLPGLTATSSLLPSAAMESDHGNGSSPADPFLIMIYFEGDFGRLATCI